MNNTLIIFIYTIILSFHDFHVTHTTLYYNNNTNSIEITIKVAIEDLERTLEELYNKKLQIGTTKEKRSALKIIDAYFQNNLKLFGNDEQYKFHWIGKEVSQNMHDIYLYFEIPNCNKNDKLENLKIENTIFFESILPQTNILLVEFQENNYNLTFSKDHKSKTLFFKN